MLFQRITWLFDIFNSVRRKQKSRDFADWSHLFNQQSTQSHNHKNGIWKDPVCLVILSAYGSINLNVKNYKTENKMHVVIEYKWEKKAMAALILNVLITKFRGVRELRWWHISSATMLEILPMLFVHGKWYPAPCSDYPGAPYLCVCVVFFKF